ncbi:hypothetical protein [Neisseria sp.]
MPSEIDGYSRKMLSTQTVASTNHSFRRPFPEYFAYGYAASGG